jgi:hypothetical protein
MCVSVGMHMCTCVRDMKVVMHWGKLGRAPARVSVRVRDGWGPARPRLAKEPALPLVLLRLRACKHIFWIGLHQSQLRRPRAAHFAPRLTVATSTHVSVRA